LFVTSPGGRSPLPALLRRRGDEETGRLVADEVGIAAMSPAITGVDAAIASSTKLERPSA
jgi:hypothetical protein